MLYAVIFLTTVFNEEVVPTPFVKILYVSLQLKWIHNVPICYTRVIHHNDLICYTVQCSVIPKQICFLIPLLLYPWSKVLCPHYKYLHHYVQ